MFTNLRARLEKGKSVFATPALKNGAYPTVSNNGVAGTNNAINDTFQGGSYLGVISGINPNLTVRAQDPAVARGTDPGQG